MTYDNILKALKSPGDGLTTQQQSDNYRTFSELMEQGVYLPGLLDRIKDLESKVEALEKPQAAPIDAKIFELMESKVRNDPEVAAAKARLAAAKTRIISDMCMRDEEYRRLFDEYRTTVHAHYVGIYEEVQAPAGGRAAGLREDAQGGVPAETRLSVHEGARAWR